MGAEIFITKSKGNTAQEAFNRATEYATYQYGHEPYSGTIKEKNSFIIIILPKDKEPYDYAQELINLSDIRIDNKWGPAGCFKLNPVPDSNEYEYLFFGWASC